MSSRISNLVLAACLASCSVERDDSDSASASGEAGATVGMMSAAKSVPCALGGAKLFKQDCAVERQERDGARFIVVRHPDGGFRRLVERDGGRSYAAADGATVTETTANGADIEVTVADDRYLFPAPAGSHAPGS